MGLSNPPTAPTHPPPRPPSHLTASQIMTPPPTPLWLPLMTRASALGRVFPQISFRSCLRCALSLIQSATRVHIQFYQVPTSRTSSSGPDLTQQPLHALLQPPLSSHSRWEAELRGSTTTATECQKILSFQIVHLLLTCPISVYALRGRQVVILFIFLLLEQ